MAFGVQTRDPKWAQSDNSDPTRVNRVSRVVYSCQCLVGDVPEHLDSRNARAKNAITTVSAKSLALQNCVYKQGCLH